VTRFSELWRISRALETGIVPVSGGLRLRRVDPPLPHAAVLRIDGCTAGGGARLRCGVWFRGVL